MSIDLNAPEVQDAIKEAVKQATEGLVGKNTELLRELKEAKKGRSINPEDVTKLEDRIEELSTQLSTAQRDAKTATTTGDKATKALEKEQGVTQRLLVDNGLNDALAKAGVSNPVHLKAVKSMLAGQVQIAADGDQRVAKVGDKPLAEFVTEWAKGDEGKFFVAAPNNTGGGSQGGGNNGGGNKRQISRAEFDKMDPLAQRAAALDANKGTAVITD